jgi:hypothetical protein
MAPAWTANSLEFVLIYHVIVRGMVCRYFYTLDAGGRKSAHGVRTSILEGVW